MKLKQVVLLMALALLCGMVSVTLAQAQSPDALGKAIVDNYLEALKNLNELMKDRPEPGALTPKVDALKEETIKKMVDIGQQVAKLDDAGKKKVDAKVSMAFGSTPRTSSRPFLKASSTIRRKMPTWGKPSRTSTSSPSTPCLTS